MLEANHGRFSSAIYPITHRALSSFFFKFYLFIFISIFKKMGRVFSVRVRAKLLSGVFAQSENSILND